VKPRFLAIVNPAAGGGRCGRLAPAALERVRQSGIELDVERTRQPGDAIQIAREAYRKGVRHFLAVGGDGTSYEIVNGVFPEALSAGRPTLGFLPLGTGNSFLRDFSTRGVEHTIASLRENRIRSCDIVRLTHADGELYFLNLVSLGFPADVGELTNRKFKRWGELGYVLGVFTRLLNLRHAGYPHKIEGVKDWDRTPVLFLAFSNSKFTGGKMMIAPRADASDGLIEYVRWGPIGRLGLLWTLPRLFTGTHIEHRLASRAGTKRIDLMLKGPVNAMIDGEILRLNVHSLEILPSVLDVLA
jgi:diacylglycerol kinase (ATP)